jgi:hypothetical protein
MKLYIDNINVINGDAPINNIQNLNSKLDIGGYITFYHFNGMIDDVRIYIRSLTTDEITSLYNE